MLEDPQELILEHLRYIREKVDALDSGQKEPRSQLLRSREDTNSVREDINFLRSDILRLEKAWAVFEDDMQRVKYKLDLEDIVGVDQ